MDWDAVKDAEKIIPSLTWLIVWISAIPGYSNLGWIAPVVCAVYSALLSLLATYDIFCTHAKALREYVPLLQSADIDVDVLETDPPQGDRTREVSMRVKFKIAIAGTSLFVTVFFTIMFLAVAYGVIAQYRDDMPCDGECEDCSEDPNCSNWIADVEKRHPVTNVCPPARASADTDVTFSCTADGFWMLVTSVVNIIWSYAVYREYLFETGRLNMEEDGDDKVDREEDKLDKDAALTAGTVTIH